MKIIIKTNKEIEMSSTEDWVLAYASNSDFYIPQALHVERNDESSDLETDIEASLKAEKDGIPLISGMEFIPNKVYVDTEENRQILLKMLEMYPEYKKIGLLDNICEYYECNYQIFSDGKVMEADYDSKINNYPSIDKALKRWVSIMKETNQNLFETGDMEEQFNTWSKSQIEFIENL